MIVIYEGSIIAEHVDKTRVANVNPIADAIGPAKYISLAFHLDE